MVRLFTGPSKLMEIPVGCASPHALHTAKTSYLGMMAPCRNDIPVLPVCFSTSISLFIAASLPVVDDCLHLTGSKCKPPLSQLGRFSPEALMTILQALAILSGAAPTIKSPETVR
jgi:hypothetical protein